jgi:hypothetical protein
VKRRCVPLMYAVDDEGLTRYYPAFEAALEYLHGIGQPEFLYMRVNLTKIGTR